MTDCIRRAALKIDRCLGGFERLFLWAACGCMAVMLAINVANLVYRNVTGTGISWVWAWTGLLFVWSVFLCFFVIYRRDLDIKVGFFLERMNKKTQIAVQLLSALCTVAVMVFIVAETPQVFQRQIGLLDFIGMQRFVLSIPLLLSSLLLLIHFVNEVVLISLGSKRASYNAEVPKWSL